LVQTQIGGAERDGFQDFYDWAVIGWECNVLGRVRYKSVNHLAMRQKIDGVVPRKIGRVAVFGNGEARRVRIRK